ncbi:MAG: hypothetical protein QXU97_01610 [Fervidicoccaceae archaeon]
MEDPWKIGPLLRVGEAGGYVRPLTHEGIRTSSTHALRIAEAITKVVDLREALKNSSLEAF